MFYEKKSLAAVDFRYRQNTMSLTASENYASSFVRLTSGGRHGSFYHFPPPYEAPPGAWFFPDSITMKALAAKVQALGKELFECSVLDWRPNGGSAAEQAIMLGACNRGDGIVHFAHKDGGHFALEPLAQKLGIQIFHFPIEDNRLLIDVDRLNKVVRQNPHIKLVMLDQSFKLRWQPVLEIKQALPQEVLLSYDCSHDGGLIAGEALPQPLLQGADLIHGNTHKTIPGPQKGIIGFKDESHPLLQPISDWLCPHLQSNCHAEQLIPMLMAFKELKMFGREYARQVISNAKAFAKALAFEGFHVSGESFGFTETHQVHVILGSEDKTLQYVTEVLPKAGFRCNNIEIPGTNGAFGLRIGVQAMTRRGLKEKDFEEVARLLAKVILKKEDTTKVRYEVEEMLKTFPLFPLHYSLDTLLETKLGQDLLTEILQ